MLKTLITSIALSLTTQGLFFATGLFWVPMLFASIVSAFFAKRIYENIKVSIVDRNKIHNHKKFMSPQDPAFIANLNNNIKQRKYDNLAKIVVIFTTMLSAIYVSPLSALTKGFVIGAVNQGVALKASLVATVGVAPAIAISLLIVSMASIMLYIRNRQRQSFIVYYDSVALYEEKQQETLIDKVKNMLFGKQEQAEQKTIPNDMRFVQKSLQSEGKENNFTIIDEQISAALANPVLDGERTQALMAQGITGQQNIAI